MRKELQFRDRVTADGSSGFKAESGRYHLYVSLACPWAHRTLIYRKLKGLEDAHLGVGGRIRLMLEQRLDLHPRRRASVPDPINGARYLYEVYTRGQARLHRPGHRARCCGTRKRRPSSTTSRPRSSGCSTASSTPSVRTASRSDLYPTAARRDRRDQRRRLRSRQQRRLQGGLRHDAGGLRGGGDGALRRPRSGSRRVSRPAALPGRATR